MAKSERIQKAKPAGRCVVRILGPEVFCLPKREKIKRFDDAFCRDVAMLLGKSQIENSRYNQGTNGMVLVGFFLMEDDVRRILCDRLMRYVVACRTKMPAVSYLDFTNRAYTAYFTTNDFYVAFSWNPQTPTGGLEDYNGWVHLRSPDGEIEITTNGMVWSRISCARRTYALGSDPVCT